MVTLVRTLLFFGFDFSVLSLHLGIKFLHSRRESNHTKPVSWGGTSGYGRVRMLSCEHNIC